MVKNKIRKKDRKRRRSPSHTPVILSPLEVVVVNGQIAQAIRKLSKRMTVEGVLKDLKRRRCFSKPSARRRFKAAQAAKRRRKREKYINT
jgi:small subunit ribosomal protein S21